MTTIVKHYELLFGKPVREAEFKAPSGEVIKIYKWDQSQTDEGVTMYATLGASQVLGDSKGSCEFFIGMTPSCDSIANALAEVALHGNGTKNIPNSGDTISLDYTLWKETSAKNFMFTDGDEIISPIKDEMARLICFIQLIPLFDSELKFKKEKGEDALWLVFEEKEVPYWDSMRKGVF